ncbi:hypothetical protein EJ05DRAFT_467985 [Pseudovirgaria hyperparasitica]|uniref:Zn(2)-C6 fungal-type domain-containing protein n=1 Tax=Pseudovirgaria hyperparasitica TaxID=470096 RepID=A0A6A6W1R2_9PEZI|nr:uncharacterized protein EJ05DRAFT_467985 [Pseudovirgaria hyperparasitica]KAF2754981.1 hypothetical protein EJ05DRAFT_467985 [Pseudovirgaria hyperparasitica]
MFEESNKFPSNHSVPDPSQKTSPSHTHTPPGLNPRSCVTCRKRKVKCDKRNPCGNCTKARIECIFPSPGRAPRKARKPPDAELLERLRKLESVVQNLGAQVDDETSPTQPKVEEDKEGFNLMRKVADAPGQHQRADVVKSNGVSSSADLTVPGLEARFGRLVVTEGKTRYINTSFWANLNSEVEDLKEIFDEATDDEEDYPSPSSNSTSSHQNFIFGFSSSNVDMIPLHPLPRMIPKYWSLFKENVDALVKVLHIPTIEPTILDTANGLASLPKGLEALMFTIYYGAATSLSAADCIQQLGEPRDTLLRRYRFGLEQALARAHFLDSQEIIVLQAFVIFLILLRRNDDARIIWTLTGLVVRIAQTIGLHRDGTHFSLTPFEIEMRRRLWWQVCILDARSSEDHGSDPTISEAQFDTQMPLNVNDADLYPEMRELPESRKGFTEMTFCIIRFEVANMFRQIVYVPPGPVKCPSQFANLSIQDKETWITNCHTRLEETYLKEVDMTIPLFWVTATVSRLILSKMWLVVYHPFQRLDGGASLPQEVKDKLFITSLESVEYSILLETEERTRKWGWLFKTYVQWHSLAFMLSELCTRTRGEAAKRAWKAIEATVASRFPSPFTDGKKAQLWKPLRKLLLKARVARDKELARERLELQSQGAIDVSDLPQDITGPIESFPTIDALLYGAKFDSPSLQSPSVLTTMNTSFPPTNTNTMAPRNRAAEDFAQFSTMPMDWLMDDLRHETYTSPGDDLVNWSNWDDMVRQYGTQEDPAGINSNTAGLGGTWY